MFVRRLICLFLVFAAGCAPVPGGTGELAVLGSDAISNVMFFDMSKGVTSGEEQNLTLSTKGAAAKIESVDVVGDGSFSLVTKLKPPFTIQLQQKLKLVIRFAPKSRKAKSGRLRIKCPNCDNVDNEGFFYIKFRITSLPVLLSWGCSKTLAFGLAKSQAPRSLTCQVINNGGEDVVLTGVRYIPEDGGAKTPFQWRSPKFPVAFKTLQKIEFEVAFVPGVFPETKFRGRFLLETKGPVDTPSGKLEVRVSGSLHDPPRIALIPQYRPCQSDKDCSKIDGRLRCVDVPGTKSKGCREADGGLPLLKFPLTSKGKVTKRAFWIKNVGNVPVKVSSVLLEKTSSRDYKVLLQGVQLPFSLRPGEHKEVVAEYAPSDDREDKGRLVVVSNVPGGRNEMLVEASSRGCNLRVQPLKLEFRGPTSRQVTIVNIGNESCLIHKVALQSGNTDVYSLLPAPRPGQTLVPNGSFSFLVKYSPQTPGRDVDYIVINSDDPDEPLIKVELVAEIGGTRQCEIATDFKALNFGLVPTGRSRKQSLTISNKAYNDCMITSLSVLGTNPAGNKAFQLTNLPRLPLKIASGSNIRVDVLFTPPSDRFGFEGQLEIASNDGAQPTYKVKLVGSSGTLCLEVIPPNLDFSMTKFGCASPTLEAEVFNVGSSRCNKTINITGFRLAQNPAGEFLLKSAPMAPIALAAGQSVRVKLAYKAKDLGVDTATLQIGNSVVGQSPILLPLVGEGVATSDQKDVFKQPKRPKADIAFIIDDSCSMASVQNNVSANFTSFINWAVRLNIDYQILVTTTDTTGTRFPAGCARGATAIVTPQTPNPRATFQANINVGTRGSAQEKGLEAAYRMVTPPASTGCNKGFNRKDASLSLIFISNETDSSPMPVDYYVRFFKSLKGPRSAHMVRASALVGPPPAGCKFASGSGGAQAAPRYWDATKKLRGVQNSICQSNWAGALLDLGSSSFGYQVEYPLRRPADPKTIRVKINGVVIKEDAQMGWRYDAVNNAVVFSKNGIPKPGATIEVGYKAFCLP